MLVRRGTSDLPLRTSTLAGDINLKRRSILDARLQKYVLYFSRWNHGSGSNVLALQQYNEQTHE